MLSPARLLVPRNESRYESVVEPFERNRRLYGQSRVVRHYARAEQLQAAERFILGWLDSRLQTLAMLDLGVGAGRTTRHFAPRVARYVGVDYSPAMLEAAREVLPFTPCRRPALICADAGRLPFPGGEFDLVLFAHNGIDYTDHAGRLEILAEVRRVLRDEGVFVFSTHNLRRADLDFGPAANEMIIQRILRSPRRTKLRRLNPRHEGFASTPWALINDGAFRGQAITYHIAPGAQIEQLRAAGFRVDLALGGRDGRRLALDAIDDTPDPWVYFACVRA
jgi:SAM-dependent methyltransferase